MEAPETCPSCGKRIPPSRRTCPACIADATERRAKLRRGLLLCALAILAPYLLFWLWGALRLSFIHQDFVLLALVLVAFLGGFLVGMAGTFKLVRARVRIIPSYLLAALGGIVFGAANVVCFGYWLLQKIIEAVGG